MGLRERLPVDASVHSPLFRLLCLLEQRKSRTLEEIEAVLICPVSLPAESVHERFELLHLEQKNVVLSSWFHCANWFRELLNGFSGDGDAVEVKREDRKIVLTVNTQCFFFLVINDSVSVVEPPFLPPLLLLLLLLPLHLYLLPQKCMGHRLRALTHLEMLLLRALNSHVKYEAPCASFDSAEKTVKPPKITSGGPAGRFGKKYFFFFISG